MRLEILNSKLQVRNKFPQPADCTDLKRHDRKPDAQGSVRQR
jgi:hypothetical protein